MPGQTVLRPAYGIVFMPGGEVQLRPLELCGRIGAFGQRLRHMVLGVGSQGELTRQAFSEI
jgi:hypothetical protein